MQSKNFAAWEFLRIEPYEDRKSLVDDYFFIDNLICIGL